jgi:hypothetical protein
MDTFGGNRAMSASWWMPINLVEKKRKKRQSKWGCCCARGDRHYRGRRTISQWPIPNATRVGWPGPRQRPTRASCWPNLLSPLPQHSLPVPSVAGKAREVQINDVPRQNKQGKVVHMLPQDVARVAWPSGQGLTK